MGIPDPNLYDEFGLPRFILEDDREVTGKELPHQIDIQLIEHAAEVDRIRITFRRGVVMIFEEMFESGVIVCQLQTEKGTRQFAVYDPGQTGYNAMKVNAPVEIL